MHNSCLQVMGFVLSLLHTENYAWQTVVVLRQNNWVSWSVEVAVMQQQAVVRIIQALYFSIQRILLKIKIFGSFYQSYNVLWAPDDQIYVKAKKKKINVVPKRGGIQSCCRHVQLRIANVLVSYSSISSSIYWCSPCRVVTSVLCYRFEYC